MIEKFTNQYSLSKTLRFSLIPVGKTEENFNKKLLLEEDTKRAEDYQKVKGYIDRYHKAYIDRVLSSITVIEDLEAYAELYYKSGKADSDNDDMEKLEAKMRKQISKALKSGSEYKKLKSKEMITELLPSFLSDEEELEITSKFAMFTTYFSGFFSNRENMYTEEGQSTAISYRCINDNLPKFLDNVKGFAAVKANLPASDIDELNETFYSLKGKYLTDIFNVDYFPFALAQSGIDTYNQFIGGYTCTDGTKVKGLNEYINLYNQQVAKSDKSKRLPLMKVLYKQILSDRETVSFIPEKFENDNEVVSSINSFLQETALNTIASLKELFESFDAYNMNGIFISSGLAVTDLSNAVFGDWSAFVSAWESAYEASNPKKKNKSQEKYDEEMKAAYKAIKSFSLSEIQEKGFSNSSKDDIGSVSEYYKSAVSKLADEIYDTYQKSEDLFTGTYSEIYDKKLIKNNAVIEQIKNMLDAVKALEKLVKPLCGTGKEEEKDDIFYGAFLPLFVEISAVDRLYDKVRNYVTQKPYSKDKIKLNFENPQFLGGWPMTKERDYSSFILRDKDNYYLAVMDYDYRKMFKNIPLSKSNEDSIEKMYYYQAADPSKDVQNLMVINNQTVKKNGRKDEDGNNTLLEELKNSYLPSEINKIRIKRSYSVASETFNKEDLSKFIDYYKERTVEYFNNLSFKFKDSNQYNNFGEFTDDINSQAYRVWFENVSKSFINSCVDNGQLYLFQIYNKDFSEHSHGTPNLHTLYFKALFDEKNLSDVVFKLNGEAEMFYRKASIKDSEKITHPANVPIDNKNPDNPKKQSVFDYELVKDNRFTKRQFSIHIPITINYKAHGREVINNDVRYALKSEEHTYAIGIDRG